MCFQEFQKCTRENHKTWKNKKINKKKTFMDFFKSEV